MSKSNSYLDKTFVVTDPDARIRKPGDLMTFQVYTAADVLPPGERIGSFKRISQNTEVKVDDKFWFNRICPRHVYGRTPGIWLDLCSKFPW